MIAPSEGWSCDFWSHTAKMSWKGYICELCFSDMQCFHLATDASISTNIGLFIKLYYYSLKRAGQIWFKFSSPSWCIFKYYPWMRWYDEKLGFENPNPVAPHWPPLALNLWRHVVAPHSTPLKKSLQADKSSFSDAYVCVFVLYQSTRGPKDDKWVLSGRRQS